jgi:hypothetical protein
MGCLVNVISGTVAVLGTAARPDLFVRMRSDLRRAQESAVAEGLSQDCWARRIVLLFAAGK